MDKTGKKLVGIVHIRPLILKDNELRQSLQERRVRGGNSLWGFPLGENLLAQSAGC